MGDDVQMKPLVLDIDGTFLRTDILFESFWSALGKDPIRALKVSFLTLKQPARLKAELAEIADLRTDLLPVEPEVVELAEKAKSKGREVILASASHKPLVEQLARDHDLSPRVFASDGQINLKGDRKAAALVEAFGAQGFDYAGNAPVDRAIWSKSDHAIVVGDAASARQIEARGQSVTRIKGGWRLADVLRSFRPHQWVKNVLLLLPMIAGHAFDMPTLIAAFLGIVSFSAAASSIYLVNDLLDLEADRLHVKKKNRPFASGAVPIQIGMLCFMLLSAIALGRGCRAVLDIPWGWSRSIWRCRWPIRSNLNGCGGSTSRFWPRSTRCVSSQVRRRPGSISRAICWSSSSRFSLHLAA